MAPLHEALRIKRLDDEAVDQNVKTPSSVWGGNIDRVWTVAIVPNGGYIIGLIIEAGIAHQKRYFPDLASPIHLSAHFLRPNVVHDVVPPANAGERPTKVPAQYEVRVQTLKGGKTFNNVTAEMLQNNQVTVTAHMIFGAVSSPNFGNVSTADSTVKSGSMTLLPPSVYARRIPLATHPVDAPEIHLHDAWNFKEFIHGQSDPVLERLNEAQNRQFDHNKGPENAQPILREPPGLEFGAWLTLKGEEGNMHASMLPFCADIVKPLPELLPPEENPNQGKTWHATLTMTVEFKTPLSILSEGAYSSNSVGLYALGRFLQDPLGRHDTYVEVWTSPNGGIKDEHWRDKQRCLAVTRQTAICMPYEVHAKKARV